MQQLDNHHLIEKPHAFRMVGCRIKYQVIANQFDASLDSILKILDTRNHYQQIKNLMPSAKF